MARYALEAFRVRVTLKAESHQAAIAWGVRNLRVPADKIACHEIANPAEEATIPNNMSTKKKSTKKAEDIGTKVARIGRQLKAKAKAEKTAEKAAKKPSLGDRVEKAAKPKAEKTKAAEKPMSGLDAAASVLRSERRAMSAKDLVAAIQERGLAPNLGGKTPHATIYAAMITEISKRGAESRFKRGAVKGTFEANA